MPGGVAGGFGWSKVSKRVDCKDWTTAICPQHTGGFGLLKYRGLGFRVIGCRVKGFELWALGFRVRVLGLFKL